MNTYSKILDNETMGRVIAAAPVVPENGVETARRVLSQLENAMESQAPNDYYEVRIHDLATWLEVTPKLAGLVCRELGLICKRRADGYGVIFSQAQLDILSEALA